MARTPVNPDAIFTDSEGQPLPEPEEDWDSSVIPPASVQNEALRKIAAKFGAFRPAREVLTKIKSVPTIFCQFDWATKVGGLPLERFIVVHGPSNHGKTEFCLGLGRSFLERGHFFNLVDAEMTTPISWLEQIMGGYEDSPLFSALRPVSYEQTVDSVRSTLNALAEAKHKKQLPPETSALIVVDSLRKLVPTNLLDRINDGKGGIDGMGGRAAQIKAALNAAWLDELIPALHHSGATMVVIARESENTEKAGMFDKDWKMTGGKAIEYDSSLILRVQRASWVKTSQGEDGEVIGERHRVSIRKTKIAGKDDKEATCYFHTSNGKTSPVGFDRARDVFDLAVTFGLIKKQGSWYTYNNKRYQGTNGLLHYMREDPTLLAHLEAAVRQHAREKDPLAVEIVQSDSQ